MANSVLEIFKNAKKVFDNGTRKASKAESKFVAAAKKCSGVEKAAAACDKAIKDNNSRAFQIGLADLDNALKIYNSALSLEFNKALKAGQLSEPVEYAAGNFFFVTTSDLQTKARRWAPEADETSVKMKPSSFLGDWKETKKAFESNTGKKKPTTTFLGKFRKSSGVESALSAIDAATRKSDVKALEKAIDAFKKIAVAYAKQVASVADVPQDEMPKGPEVADYKEWVAELVRTLNQIRTEAEKILKEAKV